MELPPVFVNNTEYQADPVRRILSALLDGTVGFFGDKVFQISVGGTNGLTVTVSPGMAALPSPNSSYQGSFLVENPEPVTLTIDPPHPTLDRQDVLVAYVVPPANPGDAATWCLELRAGQPAANPGPPTVAGALQLCYVTVPAEAKHTFPTFISRYEANGQRYIGGLVLTSTVRPTDVRAGTIWVDWINGNVWAWEGSVWYPAGVPRFSTTARRDTAFPRTIAEGQLAITTGPLVVLWCWGGTSRGWVPIGDIDPGHHALVATASVPPSIATTLAISGMAAGHDDGIATVAGNRITLNRAGRWHIGIVAFSDSTVSGRSTVRLLWTDGAIFPVDINNTAFRATGFAGAGQMHQNITWTGNVSAAQAAKPMDIIAFWLPSTGTASTTYTASVVLEYLGR